MNQTEINNQWRHTRQSNAGELVMLEAPIRKVPGLPYPYQYQLPAQQALDLVKRIRALVKDHAQLLQEGSGYLVAQKRVSRGLRFEVFLLSHPVGFCGNPTFGTDFENWLCFTHDVMSSIRSLLGVEHIPFYIEQWQPDKKFQARFETYIKFSELP